MQISTFSTEKQKTFPVSDAKPFEVDGDMCELKQSLNFHLKVKP